MKADALSLGPTEHAVTARRKTITGHTVLRRILAHVENHLALKAGLESRLQPPPVTAASHTRRLPMTSLANPCRIVIHAARLPAIPGLCSTSSRKLTHAIRGVPSTAHHAPKNGGASIARGRRPPRKDPARLYVMAFRAHAGPP